MMPNTSMLKLKKTYLGAKFGKMFLASTMSMLVEYLVLLSDKIIVGNMLGEQGLSALMMLEPFFTIIVFFAYLIGDGSDMLVAHAKAAGEQEKADAYFSQSILLGMGVGLLLTAVYLIFQKPLIAQVCSDPTVYGYALEYFKYLSFLPLLQIFSCVLYSILLYQGGENVCSAFSLIYVISNIGLSILLGHFMGIGGVALGTVLANALGLISLVIFLLRSPKAKFTFRLKLKWRQVLALLQLSFSQSSIYLILTVFEYLMNLYLMKQFGVAAITVFVVVMNIQSFYLTLYEGLSDFLSSNVNVYHGEKNAAGIQKTLQITVKYGLIESGVVTVILLFGAGLFVKMLGIRDAASVSGSIFAVRLFACCSIGYCMLDIYGKYCVCIQRIRLSVLLNIVRFFPLPFLLAIAGGMLFALPGVWLGMAGGFVLSLALTYLLLRNRRRPEKFPYLLPEDAFNNQHVWDASMSEQGIMQLVDLVEQTLKDHDVPAGKRLKAMEAVEESQMLLLRKIKKSEKIIIQCSLLIDEQITLILRNTQALYDATDVNGEMGGFQDYAAYQIISHIRNRNYMVIQGDNRAIFKI